MLKTQDLTFDVKAVGDDGVVEGYGSVFGNMDSAGDIVDPGAFSASLKAHGKAKTMPLMLWQHDTRQPIGVWDEMSEDAKGLRVVGRLTLGVRAADEAHLLLKAGAVRGLSIGYRELAAEPDGNAVRLKKLDLREVSIVSFPANDRATVQTVKSILDGGELPTVRQFEEHLRDAGFSKALATAIASKAAPHLRGDPEARPDDVAEFLRVLQAG